MAWLKKRWRVVLVVALILAATVAAVIYFGPQGGILGALLAGGSASIRSQLKRYAEQRSDDARTRATADMGAAGDRAAARVAEVDRRLDEEVERAKSGDLVDYLLERDPGPGGGDPPDEGAGA